MLVGFYPPVWLSRLFIKELPHPIMLVGFCLPVRLESGSFIISHKIISVDVIATTNGKIHYNAIDK